MGLWINGGLKKIVNTCLLSLQKHKDILPSIFLQFPYNLLFYTVLKHQIQPFPTLSPGSNSFPPFPWLHPRIWRYSPILPSTASGKIARSPPGWGDGKNYKLSDNFKKPYSYFTSTPSQKPTSHRTSIRNTSILHIHFLSRQTDHFEK